MLKKFSILFLLAVFLLTSGFGCKSASQQAQDAMKPVTLVYWRVFDDQDAFQDIITKYKAIHPFITIEYHKLRYDEYENAILNALAEDRGPDIFSLPNTALNKYQTKLVPMPDTITMAYPVIQGTVQKTVVPELRTANSLTLKQLKDNFVDVVSHDVILNDGKIYGLPLSVDTLALYYNKDLFNNAGISQPPAYWNKELIQDVKKLTIQDPKKGLVQSGIALGGGANINRFSDILSVLMMQNGTDMMEGGQVLFNVQPAFAKDTDYNPGQKALQFYTDFANPTKESYSWSKDQTNSLDMFMSGNLAMMLSYSYDLATIKAQAPKLNFSVAPLPQIEGNPPTNINFANYWVEVVSKKSQHVNEAWDFIQFITQAEQAKSYLDKTERPTALRSLVDSQKNDDTIGVFANQVLTAKSWYLGKNETAAEDAFQEMIDTMNNNLNAKLKDIIDTGAAKVQQTVN